MTKGVILLCFGDSAYAKMAFNMALSIKQTTPDMPITLVHDGNGTKHLSSLMWSQFDTVIEIDPVDLYGESGFNPGRAKTRINKYLQYDYNIYLDIDGCCLSDLNPLMQRCIDSGSIYKSQVVGSHTIDKGRDFIEMQWAWADDIWEKYKLSKEAVMPAINSSFAFMKKCPELDLLYAQIQSNIDDPIPIEKLRTQWGKTQPDELYTNIALAQHNIDAWLYKDDGSWLHPVFFSTQFTKNLPVVCQDYYVLGLYGGVGFTHDEVINYYDRIMRKYCKAIGIEHYFKGHSFMKNKHANKRALKI